jgi:hypothetical protein
MNENYRIIRNSKYRFNDIVGSEYILPKLAEVILYLITHVIYFREFYCSTKIKLVKFDH